MESPLWTFFFLYLGVLFGLFALSVDSKQQELQHSVPPPPRHPPHSSPYAPAPPRSSSTPPPPRSHRARLPPGKAPHSADTANTTGSSEHKKHRARPSPSPAKKLNRGKKIGLLFAGVAGILQIFVVTYLVINRRQLIQAHDRY